MRLIDLKNMPNAPLFGGTGGLVDPVSPSRALFNEVLNRFANAPDDLAIMPGDLVSEVLITSAAAVQELVFNVRADQQNPTNPIRTTEQRLETRDAFVVDRIGLFFAAGADTLTPDQFYFQQFPNANTIANNGHTTAGALAVRQAYNGKLNGLVNTVQFIQGMHCSRFIYVDTAQASSATTQSAQAGDLGFAELTPAMTIRGLDAAQFTVRIPNPATFNAGASTNMIARLVLRGLNVQGGSAVISAT